MAEPKSIIKNLGNVTAYGYAKSQGYEGTVEQFGSDLAHCAADAADVRRLAPEVRTNATNAEASANRAKSWAVGPSGAGTNGTDTNNSKYWSDVAKAYAEQFAGGVMYITSVNFSNLPDLSNVSPGWMYNIKDAFVTDERFEEGAGIQAQAGSNVICSRNMKWDLLSVGGGGSSEVTGNTPEMVEDLMNITFQLAQQSLIDTSGLKSMIITDFTTTSGINVVSGNYRTGAVYI